MNRKGSSSDSSFFGEEVVRVIIAVVFLVLVFLGVGAYSDGVALKEDFYAKKIALAIDRANHRQNFDLDVTDPVNLALKNGKMEEDIFVIDNEANEVRVSLRSGTGTAFGYFNDVEVVDKDLRLVYGDNGEHILHFRVEKGDFFT